MLKPDQIFAERYRIIGLLAEGGMGAVFKAQHQGTEAFVALKLLWPHVVQNQSARKKFELEAKVAARVQSQHIVEVLDAGVDRETRAPYLVMELLEGCTLADRVKRQGPMSWSEVADVVRQVGCGLDAAHGYRNADGSGEPIVHRDLKPANLFMVDQGPEPPLIKILDFGIAKVLSESTHVSQEVRGTPLYMAFEQVAGEAVSPRTDIWALGLIAYTLLTGRRYWRAANRGGADVQALFAEILSLPQPKPSKRLREDGVALKLPPGFDRWLLRCIQRDPKRRFESAGKAAAALHTVTPIGPAEASPARPAVSELSTTAALADQHVAAQAPRSATSSPSLPAVVSTRRRLRRWPLWKRPAVLATGAVALALTGIGWWRVQPTEPVSVQRQVAAPPQARTVQSVGVTPPRSDAPASTRSVTRTLRPRPVVAPIADVPTQPPSLSLDPPDTPPPSPANGRASPAQRETPVRKSAAVEPTKPTEPPVAQAAPQAASVQPDSSVVNASGVAGGVAKGSVTKAPRPKRLRAIDPSRPPRPFKPPAIDPPVPEP